MNIIYLDRLSFFSLASLIFSRIRKTKIFYFDITTTADALTRVLTALRLLKNKPQAVEFRLCDITDGNGESQFIRISEDVTNICFEICDRRLAASEFLIGFGQYFNFKKILLFLGKIISERINDSVIFINAVRWHADKSGYSDKNIIFFLERNYFSDYLSSYADKRNVRIKKYRQIINSFYRVYFIRARSLIVAKLKSMPKLLWRKKEPVFGNEAGKTSHYIESKGPLMAAWYTGRTVTFDLNKRCDFFWLLKSDVSKEQVLIYFDRCDIPATEETANILKAKGIKFIALNRKAAISDSFKVWQPGKKYNELKNYFTALIFRKYLSNIFKLKMTPLFLIIDMLYFVMQYSYWHNFFESNNIKINISPNDFTKVYIPKNLALENCGGISISYQWSNLPCPFITFSSCSNVLFSFGPAYKWIWESNRSAVDDLIYCGYITDYSFREVKEDSRILRKRLMDKGVKFIVCFFDENSSDDRKSIIPNKRSAEIYAYFIKRMLEDATLGLIFKPGIPKTLYQRLSTISDLIEKARESGRCIFIDKGSYVTEKYPTEAAQASDLCVGLLLSGTVALESYLSGIPTVFLDLEKLYSNPVYQWGEGKVVFRSLDSLFLAIRKFKENPESMHGFGDLSSWAEKKDAFRDGNASLRMGQYLYWLMKSFNDKKTRGEAIEYANQKYRELWGEENVIKWR